MRDFRPGVVRLGFTGAGIFDRRYDRGIWECVGEVGFKGKAYLGQGTKICVGPDGHLVVGNNFRVTAKGEIVCFDKVEIGDDVLMSWDSILMDTDFHQINDGARTAPINIGDSVWVGMRTIILKGARIPKESVVAAGSIVTKAFEDERCLYGDVNRVLKRNVKWEN